MALYYARIVLFWGILFLFASTLGMYLYLPGLLQRAHDPWAQSPGHEDLKSSYPANPDGPGPPILSLAPVPTRADAVVASPPTSVVPSTIDVGIKNLTTIYDDPNSTGSRTLVIPKLAADDSSWVDEQLSDLIAKEILEPKIYIVDDPHARLRPPVNKGREGMVYLTYIIDHYDALRDISIFMHVHQYAWHNQQLLDNDAALMVRALSGERVLRDGYMNLRCSWGEQCPDVVRPLSDWATKHQWVRNVFPQAWGDMFPGEDLPEVIAQPCCSQFAVSRDAIRRLPREKYIAIRRWLWDTELHDNWSGRIMEFVWQYLFTGEGLYCPSEISCNCDGYGICFESQESFDHFGKIRFAHTSLRWKVDAFEKEAAQAASNGTQLSLEAVETADGARRRMDELAREVAHMKMGAVRNGKLRGFREDLREGRLKDSESTQRSALLDFKS